MTLPNISFEFFPPSTLDASFQLWESAARLRPLSPAFVSVTYGAGGSTRRRTQEAVAALIRHYGLNVAGHLTCVGATRQETLEVARAYAAAGVREIVALRGDAPAGQGAFRPHPDGFASSVELVEALADLGLFDEIRVGAYPEQHPEARSALSDIETLKRKFDAGATSAITQFFYNTDAYLRFRDLAESAGIPGGKIIPGILPIESWNGVRRFAARCGATLPSWMEGAYTKALRDGRHDLLSISIATELCSDLLDEGVEDLHFYTLNKPDLTRQVCKALGIEAVQALKNVA